MAKWSNIALLLSTVKGDNTTASNLPLHRVKKRPLSSGSIGLLSSPAVSTSAWVSDCDLDEVFGMRLLPRRLSGPSARRCLSTWPEKAKQGDGTHLARSTASWGRCPIGSLSAASHHPSVSMTTEGM